MSVSQRYLSDTLKKETGKTTTEHLQLYLIDEAKYILLQPNKSISEVAYELGFEYPQYFSRLFKKKEGLSPSEYREKYIRIFVNKDYSNSNFFLKDNTLD